MMRIKLEITLLEEKKKRRREKVVEGESQLGGVVDGRDKRKEKEEKERGERGERMREFIEEGGGL